MKVNRKIKFAVVLTVALTATAFAGKVKLYNGFGTQAGEFDVRVMDKTGLESLKDSPIGLYSRVVSNDKNKVQPRNFATFCVERDEFIGYNTAYNASLSKQALGGGKNTDSGDPIHPMTAYLYTQFFRGKLSNYAYGVGDGDGNGKGSKQNETDRNASADALQKLFWWLENEYNAGNDNDKIDEPTDYDYVVTDINAFKAYFKIDDANQMTKWFKEAFDADWKDIGNVRVMNLTDGSGKKLQDQLSFVPTPAAGLLGLLGIAAASVFARRR